MRDREKIILDALRAIDVGGDVHLILAERFIEQKEYDLAYETLQFCFNADTEVRECAYPLLVDLLLQGECIDLLDWDTFDWLCRCYIEPDKKKAMLVSVALRADYSNDNDAEGRWLIPSAFEEYINCFGCDENVEAMLERIEENQEDEYDHVGHDCFEDLSYAIEKGLDFSKLSVKRLIWLADNVSKYGDYDIAPVIRRFIIENRIELSEKAPDKLLKICAYELAKIADYFIAKKDYAVLTWLYRESVDGFDCWGLDVESIIDEFWHPIYECILASNDVQVVSAFIEAIPCVIDIEKRSHQLSYEDKTEYWDHICEFVSNNYLDESGNVRAEWGDLTGVFQLLVEQTICSYGSDECEVYLGRYNRLFVRNAIEACQKYFTDEALEDECIKNEFRILKEKYCN